MRHIPNILSIFRIFLIPVFVRHMLAGETLYAAVTLAASGVTDTLDGTLARKFGWVSQLGKVLDPIADKLTQLTVCVVLAYLLRDYWVFFLILLLKELIMMIAGAYLLSQQVKLDGAKWCGKVATILFYCSMTVIVLFPSLPKWGVNLLLTLTVISSLLAILLYIPEFLRYNRERRQH